MPSEAAGGAVQLQRRYGSALRLRETMTQRSRTIVIKRAPGAVVMNAISREYRRFPPRPLERFAV
jgi:hypothetical protein